MNDARRPGSSTTRESAPRAGYASFSTVGPCGSANWDAVRGQCDPPASPCPFDFAPASASVGSTCVPRTSIVNWGAASQYASGTTPLVSNEAIVPLDPPLGDTQGSPAYSAFSLYLFTPAYVVVDVYGFFVESGA
jgi:hypothetical protein